MITQHSAFNTQHMQRSDQPHCPGELDCHGGAGVLELVLGSKWRPRGDYVHVCEMLEVRYSMMVQLLAQLRVLYQDCLSVLPPQHQQQQDYVQVVPACSEGDIVHGHLMLWQLGFQTQAAIKGPPEKFSLEKSFRLKFL